MAITKLNSLAIPASTIVTDDLTYPLTNFSSTGIDDNADDTAITIDSSENVTFSGNVKIATDGINTTTSKGLFWGSSAFNRADISVTNTSVYAANMEFSTGNNANYQTRMTLDSLGNLLVGTTQVRLTEFSQTDSGINLLGQSGQEGQIQAQTSGTSTLILSRRSSDGAIADFRKDGTTIGVIGTVDGAMSVGTGDTGLYFSDSTNQIRPYNTTTQNSIDATIDLGRPATRFKDIYLSGGAYLAGTAAANHLDDYEEGTWTPAIGTGTASFSNATYTKVGRIVTVTFFFQSVSDRSASAALEISNLPFYSNSNTFATTTGLSRWINRGNGTIVAYMGGNANRVYFYALSAGADYLNVRHQDLNNASANYYATITYIAA